MEKIIKKENLIVLENTYWKLIHDGFYDKSLDFKAEVYFKNNTSKYYKFIGYCCVNSNRDMILKKIKGKYYLYDIDKYGTERYTLTEEMIEILEFLKAL